MMVKICQQAKRFIFSTPKDWIDFKQFSLARSTFFFKQSGLSNLHVRHGCLGDEFVASLSSKRLLLIKQQTGRHAAKTDHRQYCERHHTDQKRSTFVLVLLPNILERFLLFGWFE